MMERNRKMDGNVSKGFGLGCLVSVVAFVALAFLFTLMCGLLVRGCVAASGDAESEMIAAAVNEAASSPEEPGRFEKVWVSGSSDRLAPKVLRIRLSGPIMESGASRGLFSKEEDTSAPAALRRIRAATSDKSISGILLEIDSPGGGVTAADVLHDALLRYKAANTNRFVAVYMGDMCCSGGYYIAAAADRIYAHPTTITGSIGVIMNGINVAGLAKKIGVSGVTIASGENKDILNPLKEVNPEHVELLKKPIEEMYERFLGIVAKGRRMSVDKVRPLADGRIFSANEAKRNGLVDDIFHEAGMRRALKDLARGKDVRIVRYQSKNGLGRLFDLSFLLESARGFVRGAIADVESAATPRAEYRWR